MDSKSEPPAPPDEVTKPEYLGPHSASAFQDASVVAAYPRRAPYPDSLFPLLTSLVHGDRRVVLDAGTGTGDIARRLAQSVERVDAVDWSAAMIDEGKRQPGGDDPRLRWLQGRIEEAPLDPPYGLVTTGESLHWFAWEVALPRFRDALTPGGYLAIVHREGPPALWDDELMMLIRRYSTHRNYVPVNLVEELGRRGLFTKAGDWRSEPVPIVRTVDDYVEMLHSMSSFSRERMPPEDVIAFDTQIRELLSRYAHEGMVEEYIVATVVWGTPGKGLAATQR